MFCFVFIFPPLISITVDVRENTLNNFTKALKKLGVTVFRVLDLRPGCQEFKPWLAYFHCVFRQNT